MAFENIERCLELWDNDGPTLALQRFMSYYQFNMPESWTGYRDIDAELNIEEIKRQLGMDEKEEEQNEAQSTA